MAEASSPIFFDRYAEQIIVFNEDGSYSGPTTFDMKGSGIAEFVNLSDMEVTWFRSSDACMNFPDQCVTTAYDCPEVFLDPASSLYPTWGPWREISSQLHYISISTVGGTPDLRWSSTWYLYNQKMKCIPFTFTGSDNSIQALNPPTTQERYDYDIITDEEAVIAATPDKSRPVAVRHHCDFNVLTGEFDVCNGNYDVYLDMNVTAYQAVTPALSATTGELNLYVLIYAPDIDPDVMYNAYIDERCDPVSQTVCHPVLSAVHDNDALTPLGPYTCRTTACAALDSHHNRFHPHIYYNYPMDTLPAGQYYIAVIVTEFGGNPWTDPRYVWVGKWTKQ